MAKICHPLVTDDCAAVSKCCATCCFKLFSWLQDPTYPYSSYPRPFGRTRLFPLRVLALVSVKENASGLDYHVAGSCLEGLYIICPCNLGFYVQRLSLLCRFQTDSSTSDSLSVVFAALSVHAIEWRECRDCSAKDFQTFKEETW